MEEPSPQEKSPPRRSQTLDGWPGGEESHQAPARKASAHSLSAPPITFPRGLLHIRIFKAKGIKGDEMYNMGKADPYLKLQLGGHPELTSVAHEDAGSNPEWNYQFIIPLRNGGDENDNILKVEIWNKNTARPDNILGYTRVMNLAAFLTHYSGPTPRMWYNVYREGKETPQGEIFMVFLFEKVNDATFRGGFHTEIISSPIPKSVSNPNTPEDKPTVTYILAQGMMTALPTLLFLAA